MILLLFVMAGALGIAGGVSPTTIRLTEVSDVLGLGDRTFRSSTGHSLGVAWIDFDLDDDPDLLVFPGDPTTPPLLLRNTAGEFGDPEEMPVLPSYEISGGRFADIDNDGDPDVFLYTDRPDLDPRVVNQPDGPPDLLLENLQADGGTGFREVGLEAGVAGIAEPPLGVLTGHRSKTAAFLDYDLDGCIDLFVGRFVPGRAGEISNRNVLLRNLCDGTFEDVSVIVDLPGHAEAPRPTLASVSAHLDDDGMPDLLVVNASGADPSPGFYDRVLKNVGGAFVEVEWPGVGDDAQAGMGVDVADLDRDDDWDVYITDRLENQQDALPHGNVLYRSVQGTLGDNEADLAGVSADSSWGANFFDADLDGDDDLFVATTTGEQGLFYVNRGDGTFEEVSQVVGLEIGNGRGSAVADYDRDGDLDLAVINQAGPLQLFRNDTVAASPFLAVRLEGNPSNRSAIGAVATVHTPNGSWRRQVKGGVSAHSQDALELLFALPGVGSEQTVVLEILWPSGRRDRYEGVAADQHMSISEGWIQSWDFESGEIPDSSASTR